MWYNVNGDRIEGVRLDGLIKEYIKKFDPLGELPIIRDIPPGGAWACFCYDDKTKKEQCYKVNPIRCYKGTNSTLVALEVAVHEIRHRYQLNNKAWFNECDLDDPEISEIVDKLPKEAKTSKRQIDAVLCSRLIKFIYKNRKTDEFIRSFVTFSPKQLLREAKKIKALFFFVIHLHREVVIFHLTGPFA